MGVATCGSPISLNECRIVSRTFNIANVVFISDACRSVANNTRLARIDGSMIFPLVNRTTRRTTKVDVFLACGVGDPAAEVGLLFACPDNGSFAYASLEIDIECPQTVQQVAAAWPVFVRPMCWFGWMRFIRSDVLTMSTSTRR